MGYDHKKIESKWQKYWEQKKIFQVDEKSLRGGASSGAEPKNPKFYMLDMFAYPSGEGLHVGHPRGYTASDILAKYYKMKGNNVLHPFGWDAFGLPAENYAIKIGTHPREATSKNIERFKQQLTSFGFGYDWTREIDTSKPDYYKWTQWIFKVLYDNGLAYQKEAYVNWCPKDKTVLANEQVVGGCCERCGTKVEQRKMNQWFFKITNFAEDLINGLEKLDWPESTKEMQKNWIGRSEGAEIEFSIVSHPKLGSGSKNKIPKQVRHDDLKIRVFTTRPDTLFGATYVVLAPEHELVEKIATSDKKKEVEKYVKDARLKSSLDRTAAKEKTGVFTGAYAVNPANREKIPIWVADYVLAEYGFGAVMAVPAHDGRDFEFATKYKLPIKQVVQTNNELPSVDYGKLMNSDEFNGIAGEEAAKQITKKVGGKITVQYKLHDWLVSRQRYWGAPIPIVYRPTGQIRNPKPEIRNDEEWEAVSVDEKDLPVLLPEDVDFRPGGESPLVSSKEFHKDFKREVDTLDTFVCSSWYFLRYCDPHNDKEFAGKESLKYWMPVDFYIGGAEHTNGHLLYARFITKVLHKLGYLDFDEPFLKLRHQGMIQGEDGEKMSKSRGNVVNPDDVIEQYGADTMRMYEMFMGPFDLAIPWSTQGVIGVRRFLDKVWSAVENESKGKDKTDESKLHRLIQKVTKDLENEKFNTTVSSMMEFINDVKGKGWAATFVQLLAPFAPHIAEEMWQTVLGNKDSVLNEAWPEFDAKKAQLKEVTVAVQEKGKMRGTIQVAADKSEKDVLSIVMKDKRLAEMAKKYKKNIFVENRIINFIE